MCTDDTVAADLVTETDQAVEKMVSTALLERYPDFKYVPNRDKVFRKPRLIYNNQIYG